MTVDSTGALVAATGLPPRRRVGTPARFPHGDGIVDRQLAAEGEAEPGVERFLHLGPVGTACALSDRPMLV